MKTKVSGAVFAFAVSLVAQDTAPAPDANAKVTKIIWVHGNATRLGDLVRISRASISVNDGLHAVVANGSPAAVAEVERIIHELDSNAVKKDVELTFYLLSSSSETQPAGAEAENTALAPVYRQLHAIFPMKTYRLVNTMLMRSSESADGSQPQVSGMLPSLNGTNISASNPLSTYHIICSASAEPSSIIHIARLSFTLQVPVVTTSGNNSTTQQTGLGIDTKLDLREGQKVVVGTSNVEPGGITLFLVLSARILP